MKPLIIILLLSTPAHGLNYHINPRGKLVGQPTWSQECGQSGRNDARSCGGGVNDAPS